MPSILFGVGSTAIGGAERVVLKLARAVKEVHSDWTVDCVVLANERGGLDEEYRATFDSVHPGAKHYSRSGMRIAELVAMRSYDIVHCVDSFHLSSAAAEICKDTHFIQNVFPNVRTSPFAPPPAWLSGDHQYSAIVTEFRANLNDLPYPRREPGLRIAIPNGIDTDFWTPTTVMPGDSARPIDVTWCARTDREKGIDIAIELVPILCSYNARYNIITSEPDGPKEKLEDLAHMYPTFRYGAALPPERLREVFRRTKVFLSTSSVEGMPATPLEAAACGCNIVASQVDGLAEVFHGMSGAITIREPLTAGKFAEAICKAIAAPQPSCRKAIVDNYSITMMKQRYLTLYRRLLSTSLSVA